MYSRRHLRRLLSAYYNNNGGLIASNSQQLSPGVAEPVSNTSPVQQQNIAVDPIESDEFYPADMEFNDMISQDAHSDVRFLT